MTLVQTWGILSLVHIWGVYMDVRDYDIKSTICGELCHFFGKYYVDRDIEFAQEFCNHCILHQINHFELYSDLVNNDGK